MEADIEDSTDEELVEIADKIDHARGKVAKSGGWELPRADLAVQANRLRARAGQTEEKWCHECETERVHKYDEDGAHCTECDTYPSGKDTEQPKW